MSQHPDQNRLYHDLACLWPILSPPGDYAAEAADVRRVLAEKLAPTAPDQRQTILELGAGGGHTLHHLADAFDAVAADVAEPMLEHCRSLNPGVETVLGDMRDLRLGRTFDAVLIHDAIDYMASREDVRDALATAAAHLNSGGVVLVAPTYTYETFTNHACEHDHRETDELSLTYVSYVRDADPEDETFELILTYYIALPGQPTRIEHDRHTCGLFGSGEWMAMLDEAGFNAEFRDEDSDEAAWVLFVGVKR